MIPPLPAAQPPVFRTTVHGTVFGDRAAHVGEVAQGQTLLLIPDPPTEEEPAVWVHVASGDPLGHLPPEVNSWLDVPGGKPLQPDFLWRDARLIIVGSAVDHEYTNRILRIAANHGEWIDFREDLSRDELNRLMGHSRYGIQAMENEHFGMATAEMTRAGMLVFAHDSGGSPEVLNNESALLWSSEGEAVRKILNVHDIEPLRARLKAHAQSFSTQSFVERFRAIVESGSVSVGA